MPHANKVLKTARLYRIPLRKDKTTLTFIELIFVIQVNDKMFKMVSN